MGFGVVDELGGAYTSGGYGRAETPPGDSPKDILERLRLIHDTTLAVVAATQPDTVSIERIFFSRSMSTAILSVQARGVILLALQSCQLEYHEYTPSMVKQVVTGNGRADKKDIQEAVRRILKLDELPRPVDAADALAIALTHFAES